MNEIYQYQRVKVNEKVKGALVRDPPYATRRVVIAGSGIGVGRRWFIRRCRLRHCLEKAETGEPAVAIAVACTTVTSSRIMCNACPSPLRAKDQPPYPRPPTPCMPLIPSSSLPDAHHVLCRPSSLHRMVISVGACDEMELGRIGMCGRRAWCLGCL